MIQNFAICRLDWLHVGAKKSKKDDIKISFIGKNTQQVTGSMALVEFKDYKMVIDCGCVQSNRFKDDMIENKKRFKFKPKDVDFVFITHNHFDHQGLLPRLYSQGCQGKIIVSNGTKMLLEPSLLDSARININDTERYNKKYKTKLEPLYTEQDVLDTIQHVQGYDYNIEYQLNEYISFTLLESNHIVGAYQLLLKIRKDDYTTKTILFTGDIGSHNHNELLKDMDFCEKADICIGEATYGDQEFNINKKQIRNRKKDMEFMKCIIDNTLERQGRVLVPIFSLMRCQEIMICLYRLYKNDCNFNSNIYIDTPLGITYCELFRNILTDEKLELWEDVLKWDKIKYVKSSDSSKQLVASKESCIILSASGMLEAGRIVHYLPSIVSNKNHTILFTGFSPINTLAGSIKNYEQSSVSISGKQHKKKCEVHELKSFSGHADNKGLIEYYMKMQMNSLYLVHGSKEAKLNLKHELEGLGIQCKVKIPEYESCVYL